MVILLPTLFYEIKHDKLAMGEALSLKVIKMEWLINS
jgi:hypothetical protein